MLKLAGKNFKAFKNFNFLNNSVWEYEGKYTTNEMNR